MVPASMESTIYWGRLTLTWNYILYLVINDNRKESLNNIYVYTYMMLLLLLSHFSRV